MSAASELPEKLIPLSPDAEKQEHEKAILYKEVFRREWLAQFFWLRFVDKTGFMHSDICSAVKLVRTTPIIEML